MISQINQIHRIYFFKINDRSYYHLDKNEVNSIVQRVKAGPTMEFKMLMLKSRLASKFWEEDAIGTVIKQETIVRWVNELMIEMQIDDKFCSRSFVDRFKRENNIVSRKITHIVQANKMRNHGELIVKSQDFVEKINKGKLFVFFSENFVF